jgi:hypothetical protein
MPTLTRRRYPECPDCWHVYYGDVLVGTVARRSGVPIHVDQWEWSCGFYPLSQRGVSAGGTTESFEQAREAFAAGWADLQPRIEEADYAEHRRHRAFTAWKYAMHDAGLPLPTQLSSGHARCFCGADINIKSTGEHVAGAHLEMQ